MWNGIVDRLCYLAGNNAVGGMRIFLTLKTAYDREENIAIAYVNFTGGR
ncbi:hypothetical protein [Calothrix sp. NIES-2098]|nr:hypothetical protein NIES2098_25230 [Calothrix sp. NIES-2098]